MLYLTLHYKFSPSTYGLFSVSKAALSHWMDSLIRTLFPISESYPTLFLKNKQTHKHNKTPSYAFVYASQTMLKMGNDKNDSLSFVKHELCARGINETLT